VKAARAQRTGCQRPLHRNGRLSRAIARLRVACLLTAGSLVPRAASPGDFFAIQVVDDETGRGVPLVALETVNHLTLYTDSGGLAAFAEPGLMNREVFFHVRSHGYEFPKDGFGYHGVRLTPKAGGSAVLKIKRLNLAERLYRVTGEGIYRDSVLAGRPIPLREPLLNGAVLGQDTVMAIPYRGRIYWFWGDTDRPEYPLGHFGTAGATSELPGRGGLDPSLGVDLHYFTNAAGFSRPMCDWPVPGMKWTYGLMTVRDPQGREQLLARCDVQKSLAETVERWLVRFNPDPARFERFVPLELQAPLAPGSHPFRVRVQGEDYYYFPSWAPQPCVRVRADWAHVTNIASYEAFTCLRPGARWDSSAPDLDRDTDGTLVYAWKTNTDYLDHERQARLVSARALRPTEGSLQMLDIESGKPVRGHTGSVFWNAFRQRWVMIAQQGAGEIWFAEADSPVGPWVYARQIVRHDHYNFYNPTQHPFFDQAGGRLIYFEGTYTDTFSDAPAPTPRYNYNQIMYRLDLADARLALPVAVYRVANLDGTVDYLTREGAEAADAWQRIAEVAFFAIPPSRAHAGLVPVYAVAGKTGTALQLTRAAGAEPCFYALPAAATATNSAPASVPLFEFRRADSDAPRYSTDPPIDNAVFQRAAAPLCRVWRNPMSLLILDREARPPRPDQP
jgi:hypothetical protein